MSGGIRSDFDDIFFITSELDKFAHLLARLRHFEGSVSREFRALQRNLRIAENTVSRQQTTIEQLTARIAALENANVVQHENDPPAQNDNEIRENELDHFESFEDAHVLMIQNPFQSLAGNLEQFDGNPQVNFSNWCSRFQDQLGLFDNLSELQKLHRLKISLTGIARKEMERVPDPANGQQKTLDYVINYLKQKFPSTSNISLAKQQLTGCRQAPGEPVHVFANRLSDVVSAALAGKADAVIEERLLDEFVERLLSDLSLYVKSIEPTSYGQAFEAAIKKEAWLKSIGEHSGGSSNGTAAAIENLSRRLDQVMVFAKERREYEVIEMSHRQDHVQQRRTAKQCYYCKKTGHLIAECERRKQANQGGYHRRHDRSESRDHRSRHDSWDSRDWRYRSDDSPDDDDRYTQRNNHRRSYRNEDRDFDRRRYYDSPPPNRVRLREANVVRAVSPVFLM